MYLYLQVVTCSICNKTAKLPCSKRSDVLKGKKIAVESMICIIYQM